MDEVETRFAEVMVNPDKLDAARALKPLHERQVFGRGVFLFENADRAALAALGEIHTPSIADLFVAKLSGQGASETTKVAA
jgi:ABC-2 type transport system ATP-binding protein